MAKAHIGFPAEDLPPIIQAILQYETEENLLKRVYCKHKASNLYNAIEVMYPEFKEMLDAFRKRCDVCPLSSVLVL
jgi:hypothetical protein